MENPLPHRGRWGTARESERWVTPGFRSAPHPNPLPRWGEGDFGDAAPGERDTAKACVS
jgi:hypothetical protein